MGYVSKISSTGGNGLERRLPFPADEIDFNFCRNPSCSGFGIAPDPYKRPRGAPAPPAHAIRGAVMGAKHQEFFRCPSCSSTARIKNNKAIVEEYRRQTDLQAVDPNVLSCQTNGCFAQGSSPEDHPEFYWKFGKTGGGDRRWRCRLCLRTFSEGRPARRQKRSDKNRLVFQMLCNGVPLSKIAKITELSYRDIYAKIDYFYDQVRSFTVRRQDFSQVDFNEVGLRFATDSQSLTLNWPTKRSRAPVVVQHLCTAHARSGFIMEASVQLDTSMTMDQAELLSAEADEEAVSIAFREHARVWTKSEFEEHLAKLLKSKKINDVDLYQLPHQGCLVRYDILQFAHALRLRDHIAHSGAPLVLVMDDDRGLQQAFCSVFAPEVRKEQADIAVVSFDKGMTNGKRNQVVADGQNALAAATGIGIADLRRMSNEEYADLVDEEVACAIIGEDLRYGYQYPFSRKSEPQKRVWLLTDSPDKGYRQKARLLRLATLRSVDSYFHKVRSNISFAARAGIAGTTRHTWDRHYLYKPELMVKIAEIFRFHHNWCEPGKDKKTPAMRLGLAKGRIYERDFI